jgi:hypothetical protein
MLAVGMARKILAKLSLPIEKKWNQSDSVWGSLWVLEVKAKKTHDVLVIHK